jgi:hypothetical protein
LANTLARQQACDNERYEQVLMTLLAVDLGLRTGLALYGTDGRLRWYRSHNFGTATRLRRGAQSILGDEPDLQWLLMEGGGNLALIWQKEAQRRGISVMQVAAETWRRRILLPREQRNGAQAKLHSDEIARRVIDWSRLDRPKSLRHDAAEAILVGLWGVLELGWLKDLPPELR